MKKVIILTTSACMLACAAGVLCYRGYEHHLNGDVKRFIVASMSEKATLSDVEEYRRQGRLILRTDKDQAVWNDYESAFQELRSAEEQLYQVRTAIELCGLESGPIISRWVAFQSGFDLSSMYPSGGVTRESLGCAANKLKDFEAAQRLGSRAMDDLDHIRSEVGLPLASRNRSDIAIANSYR